MFGQGFNYGFLGKPPCFTDTTDIFKDNSGVALYTLDYDASDSGGATGKFNEGIVLNGSNNVSIPGSILGDFHNAGTHAISVSSWVYFLGPTSESYAHVISMGYNQSGKAFWLGIYYSGNTVSNELYLGGPSATTLWTAFSMPIKQWTHLVLTYSGTSVKLYINKTLNTTQTTNNLDWRSSGNVFKLGEYYYNTNYKLKGSFDQTRIFNKAITQTEVNTLNGETDATTNTLQVLGDSSCKATYTFDGNLNDLSGNYNATSSGIFKYDGTPTTVDFGVGGKSLYGAKFNGSSSNINTTIPASVFETDTWSISLWLKHTETNFGYYAGTTTGITVGNGMAMGLYGDGARFDFIFRNGTTTVSRFQGGSLAINTWTNIVVVSNNNSVSFYQNGSLMSAYSSTFNQNPLSVSSFAHSQPLYIGRAGTNTNDTWGGIVDQVRIFDKALSSSEVSKLYGNGAGEIACAHTATTTDINYPTTNLAYYKLDNNSKDSAKSSGKFNQAAIFNGSSSAITLPSIPGLPTNTNNTNDFTFSCWVRSTTERLNNGGGSNPIFQNYIGSYQFIGFGGNDNGNFPAGRLFYYTYGGSGYHNSWVQTSQSFADGDWHHVVVTDKYNSSTDNRTRTIYVDGTQQNQDTVDKNFLASSSTTLLIGDSTGSGNRHLDGDVDQIRIYNAALDSTDVSNLYAETASTANTLSFPSGQTAIATYKLDGDSTDLSGNYNGTDTNVTYAYDGTESNIEYRFGRYGQAAVFNGSSSYITASGLGLTGNPTFSVSTWINTTSSSADVFFFLGDGGINASFYISVESGGVVRVGEFGFDLFSSTTTVNDSNWHHIAFTSDGTTSKLYIDGTESNSVANTFAISTDTLELGRGTSSYYYEGKLDQLRIYSSALTPDQVTQLYNEKPETDTSNFKTVLYEGNSGTNYISNVGFQPDLVWTKSRTSASWHWVANSIVGGTLPMASNATNGSISRPNHIQSFDANGFTLGADGTSNSNGVPMVAWVWKAGGNAVSNTVGDITSTVSANTDAGFSVVKYTPPSGGSVYTNTVGHGLSSAPEIIIQKATGLTVDWYVHTALIDGSNDYLVLNSTAAKVDNIHNFAVTSTTFTDWGWNGNEIINYLFHSVSGHSKIGTYEGNGTNDYSKEITGLGFDPSFVMVKNVDSSGSNWDMIDSRRGDEKNLYANESYAENANSPTSYGSGKFITDGFQIARGSVSSSVHWNKSGDTYIYMAFK